MYTHTLLIEPVFVETLSNLSDSSVRPNTILYLWKHRVLLETNPTQNTNNRVIY